MELCNTWVQIVHFILRQFLTRKTEQTPALQTSTSEKRQAFLRMEELKKQYPFPKDYDYELVRDELVELVQ